MCRGFLNSDVCRTFDMVRGLRDSVSGLGLFDERIVVEMILQEKNIFNEKYLSLVYLNQKYRNIFCDLSSRRQPQCSSLKVYDNTNEIFACIP